MNAGFASRIMFGSDQMIWPDTMQIAIETIEQAPFLTGAQKRGIFYENAARFLHLDDATRARHRASSPRAAAALGARAPNSCCSFVPAGR